MKTYLRSVLAGLALWLGMAAAAFAQQGSLVQQSPSRLDSGVAVMTVPAQASYAVNVAGTGTITVPGGQYAYITGISYDVCTNGTGTAANNVNITTTNLYGAYWPFSIAATASICQHFGESFAAPLKSAASGTNVTFVLPTAMANNGQSLRVYYYLGQ